jgi:hypothetical protein
MLQNGKRDMFVNLLSPSTSCLKNYILFFLDTIFEEIN